MSGIALIMMILFCAIIWGGLVLAALALRRVDDHTAGDFGASPHATDTVLIDQEYERTQ